MDDVRCPSCNQRLVARAVAGGVPHSWDDLVYRCDDCELGYSNSASLSGQAAAMAAVRVRTPRLM